MLPHVLSQPLAYLYLSQIPYTGLDLGPVGTVLYWLALVCWSLALAYLILFGVAPVVNRRVRDFASRVASVMNAQRFEPISVPAAVPTMPPLPNRAVQAEQTIPEPPRGYSSYEGFKSYARGGALSIDDIVKGLSRHHRAVAEHAALVKENVEPVYDKVEPIYENVEAIAENRAETGSDIRGFASALVEGDRAAVFAGLRTHIRGGGAPEQMLSKTACLIDDVYRARIDGSSCDADIARLSARLDTPTLEKLVAALTTAIDSSYSAGVTGAKLALTRALATLGA